MPEVPLIKTATDPETLRELVIAGHVAAAGVPPNWDRLGVAWSQLMLESGRGQKAWNHNFGNLKCNPKCQESMPWVVIPVEPGSSEGPIQRAYPGPVEGCAAYWRLIGSQYAQALPYFDRGEAADAMIALWNGGKYPSYFEAEPKGYAASVAQLFKEYENTFPRSSHDPGGPNPTGDEAPLSTIVVLGVLGLALGAGLYVATR